MRARTIVAGAAVVGLMAGAYAVGADRSRDEVATAAIHQPTSSLWQVYDQVLRGARYIDLTHRITPGMPVWKGFGPSSFAPSVNPDTGQPYTYDKDGFEATHYDLSTDQFGTQLDPPAH